MTGVLHDRQVQATQLMAGPAQHVMLFGGGRSGKTICIMRGIIMRALKAPESLHLAVRFRTSHAIESLVLQTLPTCMRLFFPGVEYDLSKSFWRIRFENDSEIWFGGLDDGARMEKLLGREYATIWPNECSQISWTGIQLLQTRLAQKVDQIVEDPYTFEKITKPLRTRMYYDENPPNKAHWSFRVFKQGVDPETKETLSNASNYACIQMNPADNRENIDADYMATLDGMSARMRRRFRDGEFAEATENALFDEVDIDKWRHLGELPDMVRIVIAVDPSGAGDTDNADNDAIGIAVVGLGTDGNAYLLEDLTVKAGPATWGRVAVEALMRHKADCIVGEINFGGAMVEQTIQVAAAALGSRVTFRQVTASRGKTQRAEPFSAMYEAGKVRHAGLFAKLEDELTAFSTSGYKGESSPNRADALIWALAALFPALVAPPKKEKKDNESRPRRARGRHSWMAA